MAPLWQSATTPSDGDAVVTVRGDIDTETATRLWQYLDDQGHHGDEPVIRSASPALAGQLELARRHHPSAAGDQPPPAAAQ